MWYVLPIYSVCMHISCVYTQSCIHGCTLSFLSLYTECTPACVNGTCDLTVGACECDDGYIGTDCGTGTIMSIVLAIWIMHPIHTNLAACTPGTFGPGCLQNCTCVPEQEFSPCDIVSGACNCLPGYTGSACESGEYHDAREYICIA